MSIRTSSNAIIALTFFTGFYGITLQSAIVREILVVSFGSELCLGLTLSGWLCGISIGAFLAGKIKSEKSEQFLLPSLIFMPLSSFPVILAIRYARFFLNVEPGEYIPFIKLLFLSIILISTASFFVGFTFPIFCMMKKTATPEKESSITTIYTAEAAGSLAGGCFYTFFFVIYFSTFETLIFLNTSAFLLLALLYPAISHVKFRPLLFGVIAILFFISLVTGLSTGISSFSIEKRWQSLGGDIQLIESADTKYQNISIGRNSGQYNIYLNGIYSFSFPDKYGASLTGNFIMNEHPNPKKILLIGDGLAGIVETMLLYPVERIDYVELDPYLIKLITKYAPQESLRVMADSRLHIHNTDGRYFIKESSEHYDIIFSNLPDPSNAMINRMFTEDFFREAKEKLNDRGIFITSISSQSTYLAGKQLLYAASVYNSLKGVFKNIVAAPGERMFLMGGDSQSSPTSDISELAERFKARGIKSSYFTPYHFNLLLQPERVAFIKSKLSSSSTLAANTDMAPVTYLYNLMLWDFYSVKGRGITFFAKFAEFLRKIKFIWYCSIPFLFFSVRLFYILFTRRKNILNEASFNTRLAIFITGFSGMALSIILLFSFQSIFGYLYSFIGIIIALFMGGLTVGGFAGMKYKGGLIECQGAIALNQLLIMFFIIALPQILKSFIAMEAGNIIMQEFAYLTLIPVSGFLTGIQFPLSGRILSLTGMSVQKSAAAVDNMDHLGAFFGAIATGVILVPILGIEFTCYLIGFINFLIAALWTVFLFFGREQRRSARGADPTIIS
ncbi:MAG: hypothetical protein HZA77_12130 [Candidatus Schekmanbacteria bacterium]|nr:hypothetical protein [Candidatus Schekmanbacteria bacterium]